MDRVIAAIKACIEECKSKGKIFTMPEIDDCAVEKYERSALGSTLIHTEFVVHLQDGRSIQVDYQSKDKSHSFNVVPDRSCIMVKCSDHTNDFTDSWDERV